jgi:aspartate aminotransferase
MTPDLARRVSRLTPSPTLRISALAASLRAAGRDVLSLAAGEPDFETPEHIREAAVRAIAEGYTRYTPADGFPSLKEAARETWAKRDGLRYDLEDIAVTAGAKQALYNLCQVLVDPGDEVVLLAPYWVSYPDMVHLAEGVVRVVETRVEDGYLPDPEALRRAVGPRTRLLFLNSPNNPTGAFYPRPLLEAIAELVLAHPRLYIVSDDLYDRLLWDGGPFVNFAMLGPECRARSIVVNGVSKSYAMTGWRIGYAAGPRPVIRAMADLASHSTSNPNSVAQKAAEAALRGPEDCVVAMREAYRRRHERLYGALENLEGFRLHRAQGTFYLFLDAREFLAENGIADGLALARLLLEEAEVAVVPGEAFGSPGRIRLSTAVSERVLDEAARRIRGFVEARRETTATR